MLTKESLRMLSKAKKESLYPEYIGKNEYFLFSLDDKDFIIVEKENIYLAIRSSKEDSDYATYNFSNYLEHKCNYWVRDRNDIEEEFFVKVFDILLQSDIIKYKYKRIYISKQNIESFREDSIKETYNSNYASKSLLAESVKVNNKTTKRD